MTVAEFAVRVNDWCERAELEQVDAQYARMDAQWHGNSEKICRRLPETINYRPISVLWTNSKAVECQQNQISKPDPFENRMEAA